jgi:cytidine deaminase
MDIRAGKAISSQDVERLRLAAWGTRENAYVIGPTKVGCAVLGADGSVYVGCNVEHRFRSHDVHAEVNAITSMVSAGCRSLIAVFVAAERDRFTPCGACMDWIMQFANSGDCVVMAQDSPLGQIQEYTAIQLMPFYPH